MQPQIRAAFVIQGLIDGRYQTLADMPAGEGIDLLIEHIDEVGADRARAKLQEHLERMKDRV